MRWKTCLTIAPQSTPHQSLRDSFSSRRSLSFLMKEDIDGTLFNIVRPPWAFSRKVESIIQAVKCRKCTTLCFYNIVHLRHLRVVLLFQPTKKSTAGDGCGATQIFDLIRGTYVKTVAEQSALLRRECDALQLTAFPKGVGAHPWVFWYFRKSTYSIETYL